MARAATMKTSLCTLMNVMRMKHNMSVCVLGYCYLDFEKFAAAYRNGAKHYFGNHVNCGECCPFRKLADKPEKQSKLNIATKKLTENFTCK